MDRRDFLKAAALASANGILDNNRASAQTAPHAKIAIRALAPDNLKTRLAARELKTGLLMLDPGMDVSRTTEELGANATILTLAIDASSFKGAEDYEIAALGNGASFRAANEQALLYAVFEFLERQGLVFGIDGTSAPIDKSGRLRLPEQGNPWKSSPRFSVRGLLPWPDFLNCISVYNDEDFSAYFSAMLRMRFNMFGMHVYTQNEPGPLAESYLSFDFAGAGHRATLEDTTTASWGYLPQRTSRYRMGASQFFDRDTFGSDAARLAADNWEIADRTTAMMRRAFGFASQLGIRTGIGFEPYQSPAEIVRALPPEALSHPAGFIESNTARDLLEQRLADLLERYPMVDYVWLWQDENANWESRNKKVLLSATPFVQAHDFLKRHAPGKRLVLAGWGGVTQHFESLHQRVPEDIIFSSLNDTLGWDPTNEAFAKLGSRERWPIPWLEDDPSMWFPQFRASRFQMDMKRAEDFGCQGMLGIHWRHRIVDPTATYFSRACWDKDLTASNHYLNFCGTQASGARAAALAALFDDCDRRRAISSTFLGTHDKAGFANRVEIAGDYSEAFNYRSNEPDLTILARQRETAGRFRQLAAQASSQIERNRIGYFSGFVNFMVPYCDAYEIAHQIDLQLQQAVKLRGAGAADRARALVLEKCVPLWLGMAPMVRRAMLEYQAVIATRNDQGQLASMQNKFVRIALDRLQLSIKEFLGTLPAAMEQAYAAAISDANANTPRLFIPTRPSLLKPGEAMRLFIVAPDPIVTDVTLRTRRQGTEQWQSISAAHAGRGVYAASLGPFGSGGDAIEYCASASGGGQDLFDPPQAPDNFHTLNILS